MLRWLFSAPSRRRTAAQWHNQDVNQAAEVLEVRAVPAKPTFPPGQLNSVAGSPDGDMQINVGKPGKGGQYADVSIPNIGGTFSMKVHPKKNKPAVFISSTNGDFSGKLFVGQPDPLNGMRHITGKVHGPFGDRQIDGYYYLTPSPF